MAPWARSVSSPSCASRSRLATVPGSGLLAQLVDDQPHAASRDARPLPRLAVRGLVVVGAEQRADEAVVGAVDGALDELAVERAVDDNRPACANSISTPAARPWSTSESVMPPGAGRSGVSQTSRLYWLRHLRHPLVTDADARSAPTRTCVSSRAAGGRCRPRDEVGMTFACPTQKSDPDEPDEWLTDQSGVWTVVIETGGDASAMLHLLRVAGVLGDC
jgi:hypothetical protein